MTQANAIWCALAAFFFWVITDSAMKIASMGGISPLAIGGIMGAVGVIWSLGEASYRRDFSVLRTQRPRQQALVSLAIAICACSNALMLKHLPLTIFYIIVFSIPLVLAAAASFLKHEKLTTGKIACLVVGFIGVLIVIAPRLMSGGEWVGYIAGIVSVVTFVIFTLGTKQMPSTTSPQSLLFWNFVAMLVVGIVFAAPAMAAIPLKDLVVLTAAGGFNILANALYNKALRHTSATNVGQLHYTQIIFGAVAGYFLWQEIPTWNLAIGSVLIIASGMVVAAQASKA